MVEGGREGGEEGKGNSFIDAKQDGKGTSKLLAIRLSLRQRAKQLDDQVPIHPL